MTDLKMGGADYNATLQEIDVFEVASRENLRMYQENSVHEALTYSRLVTDTIGLMFCLIVVAFDLFLIYVLCRFKKLKCQTNSYIMHYAIVNILYFLDTPIFYLLDELGCFVIYRNVFSCILVQFENVSLLLNFLFAFALGFDWLIMCYKPTMGTKISNIYKYFIRIIYISSFILFLVHVILCCFNFQQTKKVYAVVIYIFILLFIIILNCLSSRNENPNNNAKMSHSLTIANIILFSWLPAFIYEILLKIAPDVHIFTYILLFTEFIPTLIAFANPVVIVFMLGRLNKYFKMAYQKVFKTSIGNYSNNEDNLDESEGMNNTPTNTYIFNNDVDSYI